MPSEVDLRSADFKLGIIGCGTMGRAIISALLDSETLRASQIIASVHHQENVSKLEGDYPGSTFVTDNIFVWREATVVILCVKPQILASVIGLLKMHDDIRFANKLVISIAAGVRLAQLQDLLPECCVIRAMPNTPCKIRAGMVVMSHADGIPASQRDIALTLMSPLGRIRFVSDHHMDAVTALSGSGPAFACVMMEALADGGVMMGLPRDIAFELAAQSLLGASKLALESGRHPAQIKDDVTTPAGCTIAGLLTMEDGKIRSVLARTIQEATNVAASLGQERKSK